ncbi:MAG: GNAT family N-acetyltransferase [Terriglobia bacterium]
MPPLANPEIIDIRRFQAADFRLLLDAESRVWGEALRWDYVSASRLVSTCLDEKRLSGYALLSGGGINGYGFFFYEAEKALIGDLFVMPGDAAKDRAVVLLERVLETLLATPGLGRVEAQLPHFHLEDLEPCFRAHGFESCLRRFMAVPLAGWDRPRDGSGSGFHGVANPRAMRDPRISAEFLIEPWDRRHDHQVAQLIYHTYHRHVDGLINDQYASAEGATRLMETITHLGGCGEYLSDESVVAIHRPTRRVAALLALTAVRPRRTAHIPQVAVAREFQGMGLGTALMERAFARLAVKGFQEVSLTVTDLNAGAVRLYERLGFTTFQTFGAFVWNSRE